MFFQRFVKLTGFIPLQLYCMARIRGKKNLPKAPFILVANHGSMLDPVVMHMTLLTRHISFLCSPGLFRCPRICQAFLRKMGAIPLTNGVAELTELRARAEKADAHHVIGFFSQGTISNTQSAFKPGAAALAQQTGLPLVPVYMRIAPFFRGGSRIRFGEPMPVEKTESLDREKIAELTEEIRKRVYALSANE